MWMEIYSIKLPNWMEKDTFNRLLELVSVEKRERIMRFKFFDDAQRCLLGDLLVRYVVCNKWGLNNNQLSFCYNEYGKPYIKNYHHIHFNISHSGEWILGAFSDKQIGIDVEQIKPIELSIAKRFFCENEYADLMGLNKSDQLDYFYTIWTLKECYIKAVGKGLTIPLKSIGFSLESGEIKMFTKEQYNGFFFESFSINNNHKVSVCASINKFSPITEIVVENSLFFNCLRR